MNSLGCSEGSMHIFKSILLLLVLFTSLQAKTLKNDKESILALGMEMSTMRNMLKSYILIGAKTIYDDQERPILKNGFQEYENLLLALEKKYPQNPQILQSIQTSRSAWVHVKKAMQLALKDTPLEKLREGAIFIHANIRTVIKQMEYMKKLLIEQSNIQDKEVLNASIEIAASARRLSAHYMMSLWHLKDPTILKHWNKGMSIYAHSLEVLKNASIMQNPKFAQRYRQSVSYHRYFEKMSKKPKIYYPLINRKAEQTFREAQRMTQLILQNKR